MSPNGVFRWLRCYWWVVLGLVVAVALSAWLARGALKDSEERRASRTRIEASTAETERLGRRIEDQNEEIKRVALAIDTATSPETQARNAAALARIIADLRRSIDCAALYAIDERPAACTDITGRMDRIREGEDPFATSTTSTTVPTGA
jgi:hypothetical protein